MAGNLESNQYMILAVIILFRIVSHLLRIISHFGVKDEDRTRNFLSDSGFTVQSDTNYRLPSPCCGEKGIRTLAPVSRPIRFPGVPLNRLGISPIRVSYGTRTRINLSIFLSHNQVGHPFTG